MNDCSQCGHMQLSATKRRLCRNPEAIRWYGKQGAPTNLKPHVTTAREVDAACGPHGDLFEALPVLTPLPTLFRL